MTAQSIEVVQHERWGRCVSLGNGSIELLATLDFGPRIIHLSSIGGKNLFFEDLEEVFTAGGEPFEAVGGGTWKIYGGHRLWTSPEAVPRTTYPDNEPVDWSVAGDYGIVLRPAPERWNQITKEIEVRFDPQRGGITVIHRVTNNGAWPVKLSPWALSVMSGGGRAIVPMSAADGGMLPNRRYVHWSYNRLNDPRVSFTESELIVDQGEGPTPYKIGADNEAGWAAYSNHGDTFIKRYDPVRGGSYPDFGVSFELYTNSLFLELETLGEYKELAGNETAEHIERWQVVPKLDLRNQSGEEAVALLRPHVQDEA